MGDRKEASKMNNQEMFEKILNKIESMDSKLDRIENRVNATFEQTAGLSEFRTEANGKLENINNNIEEIRSDVSLANITSSKNRIDIEVIKNVINK
ncbi:hypothetical protein GM661_00325 [Iocasia frigidifontis]|uniref:Uncharacterized protein n=1 Tax=Iocasia fonsfrigidae TaxID=2682810 RepID=A0A8A7KB08_9FIRM|nr:hypothetical protein [Iocasia fonsfrigidae]QTL96519.1 hypothetical protein GM661_00325 [Iocasia fonsfrigidae]